MVLPAITRKRVLPFVGVVEVDVRVEHLVQLCSFAKFRDEVVRVFIRRAIKGAISPAQRE